MLIALIPALMVIPWQHGGKEPVAMLVSVMLATLGLFFMLRERGDKLSWSVAAFVWLGVAGWALLSVVWSVNRFQTAVWLAVWLLSFFGYVFGQWLSSRPSERQRFIRAYIAVAALTAGWGLVIYITQSYTRVTSSYYLANPLAAFLLPALLLGVWDWANSGRRWLAAAVPVIAAGWFLADSRTSFILAAIAVITVAMVRLPVAIWKRVGIVLVLAVAITLGSSVLRSKIAHENAAAPGARFSELATGDSTSASDRLYYLKSTLAITRQYPMHGTGAGTFGSVHPSYQYRVISASTTAHNFYAQTLSELGIPGAALLIIWLACLLLATWQAWRRKSGRAVAVVVVIMLIHLGLDIDSIYPSVMVVLGVLAGLTVSEVAKSKTKFSLPLAALLIALVLLVPVGGQYLSAKRAAVAQADQESADYKTEVADYANAQGVFANPDVITGYGIALYTYAGVIKNTGRQDLDQALVLARRAQKQDPLDAQHHFLEARILMKQNKVADAEKAYKRTIELDPFNHPEYYTDLANLYFQTQRYRDEQAVTDRVLKMYTPQVVANRSFVPGLTGQLSLLYFLHAASLANLNQPQTAIKEDLNKALKLDSNNQYAKDMLASLPSN